LNIFVGFKWLLEFSKVFKSFFKVFVGFSIKKNAGQKDRINTRHKITTYEVTGTNVRFYNKDCIGLENFSALV